MERGDDRHREVREEAGRKREDGIGEVKKTIKGKRRGETRRNQEKGKCANRNKRKQKFEGENIYMKSVKKKQVKEREKQKQGKKSRRQRGLQLRSLQSKNKKWLYVSWSLQTKPNQWSVCPTHTVCPRSWLFHMSLFLTTMVASASDHELHKSDTRTPHSWNTLGNMSKATAVCSEYSTQHQHEKVCVETSVKPAETSSACGRIWAAARTSFTQDWWGKKQQQKNPLHSCVDRVSGDCRPRLIH